MQVIKKYSVSIIFFLVLVSLIISVILFFNTHLFQDHKKLAQLTPPPTLPVAKISTNQAKKILFPAFNISFTLPKNVKTIKQIDPNSENTEIGANFVALYTKDTAFDTKTHTQIHGAKLTITITDTKTVFTQIQDLVSTTSAAQIIEDNSIIPNHNPFFTKDNMKIYIFPLDTNSQTWAYHAEGLVKNGGNILDITLYCIDYSGQKNAPVCQQLLKAILPSMQH